MPCRHVHVLLKTDKIKAALVDQYQALPDFILCSAFPTQPDK